MPASGLLSLRCEIHVERHFQLDSEKRTVSVMAQCDGKVLVPVQVEDVVHGIHLANLARAMDRASAISLTA